jgi:hypothetical protein
MTAARFTNILVPVTFNEMMIPIGPCEPLLSVRMPCARVSPFVLFVRCRDNEDFGHTISGR